MKKHFKLYKSGKKWCVMALTIISIMLGGIGVANADMLNTASESAATVLDDQTGNSNNTVSSASTSDKVETVINNNAKNLQTSDTKSESNGSKVVATGEMTPVKPQPATQIKNGWVKEDTGWTYYQDNKTSTGWAYSYLPTITVNGKGDGSNWYLTNNGVVQSGVQKWQNTYYDFDENTYLRVDNDYRQSQWGDWYLFGNDGRIQTGVQSWAGTYYYFDPLTYLRVDNDYRQSQWGDWYMFGGDGRIVSGYHNWQGTLYYFDPQTYLVVKNAFFNANGSWGDWDVHYADNNGRIHSLTYFSQFTPIYAPEGCAATSLAMLLSIKNNWPSLRYLYNTIPQYGGVYSTNNFRGIIPINSFANYAHQFDAGIRNVTGSSLAQLSNIVLSGHPVLYYGWSSYETVWTGRNHAKVIIGAHNGLYHVIDPCYYSRSQSAYTMGRNAYDWGADSWQTWGNIASEYSGSAIALY
ncbi:MAG: KxYKxGKxW signal peptide domain-containing protein [Lactobacillus sp.]|nr:KxYKxGKxW signal peptide domain-containing protein [Lactobacillus sp.]